MAASSLTIEDRPEHFHSLNHLKQLTLSRNAIKSLGTKALVGHANLEQVNPISNLKLVVFLIVRLLQLDPFSHLALLTTNFCKEESAEESINVVEEEPARGLRLKRNLRTVEEELVSNGTANWESEAFYVIRQGCSKFQENVGNDGIGEDEDRKSIGSAGRRTDENKTFF